jgi:hypothetical protein
MCFSIGMLSISLFALLVCSGIMVGFDSKLDSSEPEIVLGVATSDYIPEARKSLSGSILRSFRDGKFSVAFKCIKYWSFGHYRAVKIVDGTLYIQVKAGEDTGTVDLLWDEEAGKCAAVIPK